MRKDYKKLKKKSDATSIRFDIAQLEFIKQKEPLLRSSQEVVDFLLKAYWERYKVQPKSPFVAEQITEQKKEEVVKEKPMFYQPKSDPAKQLSLSYFVTKMAYLDKDDTAAILALKEEAESSSYLTSPQKKDIIYSLQTGNY